MSNLLHPDHLTDLRKSGLTNETIRAAGIYTVPPDEIGKKLGGLGNNVASALAFPYAGFDGYERYKVFREEGKTGPKYIQKTGTPNHLYFPPGVDLKGDSPLIIEEGEKKCLALRQAGLHVVGISGVFSWLTKSEDGSHPIDDFELVNWKRPVTILFDSDGADNPKVRLAAWRLAREVARRGGQVNVLFLPPGSSGEKVGADDYLVEHCVESLADILKTAWTFDPALSDHEAEVLWHLREIAPDSPTFDKLKALATLAPILAKVAHLEAAAMLEGLKERYKLRAKDVKGLEEDIKRERKAQAKKGDSAAPALTDLEDIHRLHPAIDFKDEFMSIGFRVDLPDNDSGLLLVISDGQGVRVAVAPETVEIEKKTFQIKPGAPPFLQDVWGLDLFKSFMAHPTYPKNLYADLKAAYKTYLDLPEAAYGLLAAWTVGTYYAHLFTAFPFLHFSGPKESGKSKSLEAVRCTGFNGWKGRDITAAALGDTADGQHGTLLLDQAEKLNSDENNNLIGLLADSYKKAGGQRRVVETNKAGRSVLEFSTYGPKAFASTKPLDPDLADRCVRIPMTRTRRKLPELEGWEPVWKELRDKLYRFTLVAFKTVRQHYETNPGNGTRIGELWRPMVAVLLALGVEQSEIKSVRDLFMEAAEENRHELDPGESILFEVLKERAESETDNFEMTPEEVLKAMDIQGEHKPGVKWTGNTLSKFSLFSKRLTRRYTDERKRKVQSYLFTPSHVLKMYEIYMRDTPQNDPSQASHTEKDNDSVSFHGTKQNHGTCPEASHEEEKEGLGRNGTRPEIAKRPTKLNEITDDSDLRRMGREKAGGPLEKNLNFFAGEEIEL